MGEIFDTVLSTHEALHVTDNEIKEAIFDIDSNKASGQMVTHHIFSKKLGAY